MSDFWNEGSNKWMNKSTNVGTGTTNLQGIPGTGGGDTGGVGGDTDGTTVVPNLSPGAVCTSTTGISMRIVVNGFTLMHIALSDIVATRVEGNTIILDTSDEIEYKLLFETEADALTAEDRIYRMTNGENVPLS